jgi:hypothetical protein
MFTNTSVFTETILKCPGQHVLRRLATAGKDSILKVAGQRAAQ